MEWIEVFLVMSVSLIGAYIGSRISEHLMNKIKE